MISEPAAKLEKEYPAFDTEAQNLDSKNNDHKIPVLGESMVKQDDETVRLDFVNVCMDVPVKGGKKRILNNVSGFVKPGEMLYIMGPSGGGKTSLLDYLTNRTNFSPAENVFFNKKKWSLTQFQKVARYCKQHPQLYEVFTVEETLNFAATFFTKDAHQRKLRVDEVIGLLGLEEQRKTKIGGIIFRGISGGQKQRVSVGEQLVANPSLLFLDEPTSGLDSASAYQLMQKLKNIAQKNHITVVSSIHQPSQRVFDLSDRLIFLAGGKSFGGNTAYCGPTQQIENHFKEIGCVNNTNSSISEWVLDEVNGDFGDPVNIKSIIEKFKPSVSGQNLQRQQQFAEKSDQKEKYKFLGEYIKQSWFMDLFVLTKRNLQNNLKNPLAQVIRVVTYCLMAVIIGSSWYNVADEPKAGDIQNMQGVLFFMATFMSMMSVSILPIMLEDRLIMVKEKSNGCYSQSASQLSNFIVTLPFTFILALASGTICFFMVGFDSDGGENYIMFILNLFLTLVAAESLVQCISYVFDHLLICIVLYSQIMGSFMVMNGFFIKTDDIPAGWMWLHYAAFNTYTYQNFMHVTFDGITIRKDLDSVPPSLNDFSGEQVLKDNDLDDISLGTNILVLIIFIVIFRLFSSIYSYFKHTGKK